MDAKEVMPAQTQEVKSEQADGPAPAPQTITLGVDEFKQSIREAVEAALKATKTEESRKEAEAYNNKIKEVVETSQASLLKPALTPGEQSLDYVKRVLAEDLQRRRRDPQGKAYYSDKGEDFTKAKIIILKKIGLSEEEIAKVFDV